MTPPDAKRLAAFAAIATAIAAPVIMQWEGEKRATYADVAGIPTACFGATGKRVGALGTRWTADQCRALLRDDIKAHMDGVLRCTPGITSRKPEVLAAATSLAFNIGVAAYCRSTVARRFNAGKWREGCEAFGRWTRAGGKTWPGLVNRRKAETALCLKGVG